MVINTTLFAVCAEELMSTRRDHSITHNFSYKNNNLELNTKFI
jgi:hypothetical protein